MSQQVTYKKKPQTELQSLLGWLESVGGFIAEIGRVLVLLGMSLVRIVQIVRGLLGYDDWREQYV